MEWGGDSGWKPNVAAANRYKGAKEGVGFHSDTMTCELLRLFFLIDCSLNQIGEDLGPYSTIASLSLGESPAAYVCVIYPFTSDIL